jgi:hypothetical protein
MYHASFAKTMEFYIPFRGLGRKIKLKTAPKSPEGDLKLQPYRNYASLTTAILFNSYCFYIDYYQ